MEENNFVPPSDAVVTKSKKNNFVPPTDAIVKKKVDSKPRSQEELWGSDSQPQDLYTSLVTDAQEPQQASDTLDGPPKMKQFTGLTPEEQQTLQAKPAEKKPVINKEIQEKIIKAEFKPKEYRDAGSRLVDLVATGSSQLGATLATVPEYGYELSVAPQKFIAEIFNIPSLNPDTEEFKKQADSRNAVKNYYQKEVSDLKEKSKQLDQQYSQGVYDSFINGDYTAGFEQLTNSFAESLPTTAAIMVGGAYAKAPQILAASTMLFGTEKSEQLRKENPEITANARIANSLASGFAQAITETIGSASIGSAAKALVAREGEKKSISILKDGLIEYYKSSLKKVPLTASAVGEGVEEWSSQVAENAVDVATGVKPQDYNVFEGGSDALLGGVFGGIVFGAGLTGIKNTVKYQDRIKIKENNKNIFNLQSQLENQSITPEIKKEIDSKIEQLIIENKKYVQDDVLKIESLPENVKEKLVSSTNKIDELTSKAKEINSSDEITIETKAILLEGLKKEAVENAQLKNSILNGTYIEDRAVEEVAPAVEEITPAEVAVKPSGQKVTDIINRPATLESQAGVKLETSIEGDVYQEGQRVIFEDKNKKTYDLGNIDEVSDKTVEELGIKPQEEMVSLTPEGKIKVGGNEWNMQSELPNYGIEYDKDGNVKAVSLKDEAGKTVMYEGQVAEDAAYQVLLKQTETPEQRQAINEILENDEELNRQLREAEEATQAAAAEVTEPGAPKTQAEQYSEELDKTKESDPEAYWSVSPVSAADAAKGTIIDTPDGAAIVKPDGDISGLFKKATSKAKGVAQDLLKRAVAAGGKKLDNFDTYLTPQYIKAGFRVVSRTPFNEEYAPEGWNKEKHGTPDVVAMIYDPENKLDIEEKTFDEYDDAIAYRDSLLEPSIDAELEGLTKLFDESEKGFRMSQVDNAKEALKKILPGVKFIVHETNEAYKNAVGDSSSGTYIMYANGDKVIHINKKNANGRTVAHEVFHAVILDKIKGDKAIQEITARMVDAVYKTASPELRAKLDAFAAMYSDKSIRDEERLAELIGIIADGYPQMSPANKSIVKRWLDALAKAFGLKPFTDNEVIDLLNTLARKVSTGEVISAEDVKILGPSKETIKRDVKRFQNDFVDPVSGIEFVYDKNTDTFKDLEKEGYITKNKSIRDFNGKFMLLHQPDGAFSGLIYKNGELLVEGKGGVYYPIKFHKDGYFWASTSTTAKKMAEDLNKVYDANNGQILMALTSAKYDKLLSSTTAANGIMEIMLSKAFDKNFSINKQQIKTSLINAANKIVVVNGKNVGLGLKIKKGSTLEEVKSEIAEKLGPDNSVFGDRKMFAESLISNVADIIKNNPKAVEQFNNFFKEGIKDKQFKGTKTKGSNLIKISATNLTRAISEMLTEPMLKEGVDRINGGQVYAILELNGKVIDIPSKKHESYPKAIQSKDLDNKVKLHILTDRVKWNNVFEDPETGDIVSENREKNIYPSFGVSTTGLKLNTKNLPAEDKAIKRSQLQEEGVTIEAKNNTLYTVNDNGKTVGSMELTSNKVLGKGYLSVNLSKLNEKYIGKGIGLDLYRTVANKLKDKGIVLTSSVFRNDKSDRVWKSLEKSGEAVKIYSDIRLKDSVYAIVNPDIRRSQKVEWEESKLGRGDKAIIDRNPVLENAAERYANKEITTEEYLKIKDVTSPIKPITDFIEPAKEADIKVAVGTKSEGKTNLEFEKGKLVGLRLDIPAYINKNIWAITVHEPNKGAAISYNNVARIENVTFESNPKVALDIARKKISKATIARMAGNWVPIDGKTSEDKGKSAMKFVESILNNPEWSQVGMNPFRHSWFYDRADGKPVLAADELIQIGGLVYAKNVVKTTPYDKSFEFLDKEGDVMRFQQAKSIDEIVRIAKEAKYSDAAISSFLKAKGFNVDEITKAILGYDKKTIETRQKEEGIFTREGRNKLATSLDSFRRRFLSARSFLGRSTFIAKEGIESGIKAQSKIASYLVSDLDNAIKKYDGDKEKVIADFDKFIRGEKVDLPDNFLEIGNAMRDHIDKLSYELINSGSVDEYQAENIKKNIGSYLNRSYEVFDKKDWAKNVDEVTLQAAKNFLKKQLLSEVTKEAKARGLDVDTLLETKANQAIENLLNKESAQSFVSSGKTGSKDISILKQKTDIPLEIRALMGEYTDPAQNYSRTIFKVASLISNAKYLNTVKNNGMNVYLFKEKTGEFNTQIAGKESETMNPLNGLYTTKELAGSLGESAGILNAIDVALPYEISGTVRSTYEYYMKLLGSVKWLKTIASVGTHFKNVSGNVTFMLANGYFKPDAYRQSAKAIYNDFLKKTDQELRDKMQEYIEAGIIDQSAVLGELRSMFKDEDFDKTFERRMNSEKLNSVNKFVDRVKRLGKKSAEFAQNAYQAEDDYFKIVSYETEKNRYANAMFRNDYSKLSEDEQSDVRDHVTEITKNVLPNYGRVPGAVKLVKAFPVVGTFISFQTEALRTAYNIVNLSVTELKSSNPEIKKIGALRMSGIIASQAIKYGVMYLIGGSMLGDDDDEKKEKAKRFVAPWSKNSNVLVKDDGDGKFSYIDFSASDPFGGIVKPINAAMRGEDLLDGFIQGTKELVSPFTNPDILKSMFTEISENKDAYGNQLYNPSDTFEVKSSAILSRVYKTFEPGTLTSVRKISKSDSPLNEMTGQFTGYKANDVDLAKQFSFKISDMKKMEVETRNIYNRAFRKFENKEITEAELQAAYNQSNKATIDTYKELKKDYDAAIYFGTDYKDLKDEMKRSKVSKDVIRGITTGDFKDLKKKEGIETDAQLKARNPKVYEKIMRFRERRKNAQ